MISFEEMLEEAHEQILIERRTVQKLKKVLAWSKKITKLGARRNRAAFKRTHGTSGQKIKTRSKSTIRKMARNLKKISRRTKQKRKTSVRVGKNVGRTIRNLIGKERQKQRNRGVKNIEHR